MSKPFTFGLGLALVVALSGVSNAGGFLPQGGPGGYPVVTPAPQGGYAPSAQVVAPSAQTIVPDCGPVYAAPQCDPCAPAWPAPCAPACAPAPKKCFLSGLKMPKFSCPKFKLEKYTVTTTKFRLVKAPSCPEPCAPACPPAPCYGAPVYGGEAPIYGSAQGGGPIYGSGQGGAPVQPIYGSGQGGGVPVQPIYGTGQDAAPAPQGQH